MTDVVAEFRRRLDQRPGTPRIIELGTLRWGSAPTHHKDWRPDADWTLVDINRGIDVDVVADAHHLGSILGHERFDAYIAGATYEHLERPWIAAQEAFKVLRPGGILFVDTHQTFPLHGYPYDFFRFSDKALAMIFADAGFMIAAAGYAFPAKISPPPEVTVWDANAPAWLNVMVCAVKP